MLRNISMYDRGVYKCIATNLIGSGSEWTLKVSVRCMKKIVEKIFRKFTNYFDNNLSPTICQMPRISRSSSEL